MPQLVSQAKAVSIDAGKFRACFDGGKYIDSGPRQRHEMQALGVDSTPTFLIGLTPAPGQPMKVVKIVRGAVPFTFSKATLDQLLAQ